MEIWIAFAIVFTALGIAAFVSLDGD